VGLSARCGTITQNATEKGSQSRLKTFAADRLEDAKAIFVELGFQVQHPRIYHYTEDIGNFWYTISVGLEDAEDGQLEPNLSILQRPKPKSELVKPNARQLKVIGIDEAPAGIQQKVRELEERLDDLS
jgi:hypothetical protein